MLNCLIVLSILWKSNDRVGKFIFYAFVINNQVLLYLYETIVASVQWRDNKSFLVC